jgi:hypothetical protein
MGYRSAGKVSTPPSPSGWVHRHRPALCSTAGFRVDVLPGSRLSARSTRGRRIMGIRGAAFQCGLRGPRGPQTHQRNGLAHVPGRDVPDVLRTDGTRKLSSQLRGCFNETTFQQRLSRACRGLGVEVSAGLQHRMHDHRQLPGQRDRRALEAEPSPQRQSPTAQLALTTHAREDCHGSFVE